MVVITKVLFKNNFVTKNVKKLVQITLSNLNLRARIYYVGYLVTLYVHVNTIPCEWVLSKNLSICTPEPLDIFWWSSIGQNIQNCSSPANTLHSCSVLLYLLKTIRLQSFSQLYLLYSVHLHHLYFEKHITVQQWMLACSEMEHRKVLWQTEGMDLY